MNNLPLEIENSNLDMDAYDSTLEANVKTVEQLEQRLAPDMAKVEYWCLLNKMLLTIQINKNHVDHNISEASQVTC